MTTLTDTPTHKSHISKGYIIPLLVCAVIAAVSVYWHSLDLGDGAFLHYDEFYSYGRSLGFAANDDWFAVYSLGEPTLKKPPMQYWMSAALMEVGVQDVLAMRLPSLFFAACTLMAAAALAIVMVPGQVWLMPATVLLLATSNQFWWHATSAMLDLGTTFFCTLGTISIVLTLKDPRYWPTFPIAVFLAGMQKAPTPIAFLIFACIILLLTKPFHDFRFREWFGNARAKYSLISAIFLGFAWPIFQKIRFWGDDQLGGNLEREMLKRFIPEKPDLLATGLERFESLILADEPWIRLAGFAGLICLPFVKRQPYLFATAGIALIFVLIMVPSSDMVAPRYTLTILPMLCVGAAWLVFALCRKALIGAVVVVVFSGVLGGPLRPFNALGQSSSGPFNAPVSEILEPLNATITADETAIFCRIKRKVLPPEAIWIYAPKAGKEVKIRINSIKTMRRDLRRYRGGAVRGVCRSSEIEMLSPYLTDLETEPLPDGFVLWSASSIVVPGSD